MIRNISVCGHHNAILHFTFYITIHARETHCNTKCFIKRRITNVENLYRILWTCITILFDWRTRLHVERVMFKSNFMQLKNTSIEGGNDRKFSIKNRKIDCVSYINRNSTRLLRKIFLILNQIFTIQVFFKAYNTEGC